MEAREYCDWYIFKRVHLDAMREKRIGATSSRIDYCNFNVHCPTVGTVHSRTLGKEAE